MRKYLSSLMLVALIALSACQTTSTQTRTYPLTLETLGSYSLSQVRVNILDSDTIKWPAYQKNRQLIKEGQPVKLKKAQYDIDEDGDKVRKFVSETLNISEEELQQRMIKQPMQQAFLEKFSPEMVGTHKVTAEVDLKFVDIPSHRGTSKLIADFRLVDSETNEQLAERRFITVSFLPGGKSNNLDELIIKSTLRLVAGGLNSALAKDERINKLSNGYAARIRFWIAPPKPKK